MDGAHQHGPKRREEAIGMRRGRKEQVEITKREVGVQSISNCKKTAIERPRGHPPQGPSVSFLSRAHRRSGSCLIGMRHTISQFHQSSNQPISTPTLLTNLLKVPPVKQRIPPAMRGHCPVFRVRERPIQAASNQPLIRLPLPCVFS